METWEIKGAFNVRFVIGDPPSREELKECGFELVDDGTTTVEPTE